jgi:hypothetical protein
MGKNLEAHESDYTQTKHKTRIRLKAALNGQPQLTINRSLKAKSYNKESLTMTSIALWTFLRRLRPAAVANEQLMLQTILV